MKMFQPLAELATIQTAIVFREKAPQESARGNVRALAIRDVVAIEPVQVNALPRVSVEPKHLVSCLQPGDVVIPSRGLHYQAWCFEGAVEPVLPIGQLNVIRVHGAQLNPFYLAWLLNSQDIQARFQALLTGTNIQALTKASLLRFEIPVPALAKQDKIADMQRSLSRVTQIRHRLNDIDRLEVAAVAAQFLQGGLCHA